jgi:hypothetical protein
LGEIHYLQLKLESVGVSRKLGVGRKSQSGEYEDFLEIGTLIADAVREARRIAPVANGFSYPHNLPEKALLAYMMSQGPSPS